MKIHKLALIAITIQSVSITAIAQNWTNSEGTPWRNASGQCWRNSSWTPATAHKECDGAILSPKTIETPPVIYPPASPSVKPTPLESSKVSFNADALFDFDKTTLKSQGKLSLDNLILIIKNISIETIISIGHTDSVGTDTYNKNLSLRRAEAVKSYLISKGMNKDLIYTEGKGESKPIATNKTSDGRKKNRRVEIEVIGKN